MTPEIRQYLADLGKMAHGQALWKYLSLRMEEIGDITKCTSYEDMLGRQHALKLLKELFALIGDNSRLGNPTKNQYH